MFWKSFVFPILIAIGFGCSGDSAELTNALESITAADLSADVQVLGSDEFEGRKPSSPGEEKTISFLKEEFQKLGLQPGNGDSYFQEVPLVEITSNSDSKLNIKGKNKSATFTYSNEYMAWTKRIVGKTSIKNSEMIFVGYGTVAPEYDWNDYAGLDVSGKTVVILVNDPGFATQDSSLFNGNSMTYYGRWTYKYEEAARQGAAGAFIIHETKPASYPWEVVSGSWSGPQFDLVSDDNNMSRCAIEGWFTIGSTRAIFKQAGLDLEALKEAATTREFEAVPMGLTASLDLSNNIRHSRSKNVIAVVPGLERADEYVFYMAHWDHLGKDPNLEGDQIYNGAFDNATGTAGLLELAEAFATLPNPVARTIVFLAVTAEEDGLLGSRYYVSNPIYPRNKTVAAINMDGLNVYGKMKDITIIGYGNSDLDDYLEEEAKKQQRYVRPDPNPEKGYFYRSDHFSFGKEGIPALYCDNGIDHVEHGEAWTLEQMDKYTAEKYHKPADEFDPNWDLSGAVDDLRLFFRLGYRLGRESTFPNWKEGTEFKAKRDADMQEAAHSSN
ncbi:M28 family peptidase [candidate division KSB1 bacterium]|nr:M28 family peptidase [candidate division KSB1 bacterium]